MCHRNRVEAASYFNFYERTELPFIRASWRDLS